MLSARRLCVLLFAASTAIGQHATPHLAQVGQTTQLIVDGKPFLMLAGEVHNSSSSSLDYMKPEWSQLAAMGLNTVLTPVSWELVEPTEGHFDFTLVDGLIQRAREQKLHIVFLWLAAWKNGMSGYPPVWVKQDTKRFSRVIQNGNPTAILSPLSPALQQADSTAFAALMTHIRAIDGETHTVLMMQVENEVGVLDAARDQSDAANKAFAAPVPPELTGYLASHRATLNEELRTLWNASGAKTHGTWSEVFGDSARADEAFMAWNYARYVQAVAAAGKAAYPLPMYVNCWLGGADTPPGDYPSGGPQPRVLDIWKAAGSSLDLYGPDLYASDFEGWSKRYHRADNPLFIPETNAGTVGAANVFYALGEQAAIGFSAWAIDAGLHGEPSQNTEAALKGRNELAESYHALSPILPKLARAQNAGTVHGFLLTQAHPAVDFVFHGITLHVSLDDLFGNKADSGFGLILEESPDTFLGVGKGFHVTFTPRNPSAPVVGIASIEEGRFDGQKWVPGRRLNGDEADQGNAWRFDPHAIHTERIKLYTFLR
jgi:beta-galactosidase GanA